MQNKKYDKKNLIIVLLLILIVILVIFLFVIAKDKFFNTNSKDEIVENGRAIINDNKTDIITEEEAIKVGKELYEYADQAYYGGEDVWPSHFVRNENGEGQTKVCDTTVEQVKQKFSKDFKYEEFFDDSEEVRSSGNIDEFLHKSNEPNCGELNRGTLQNYLDSNISDPAIKDNKVIFKATTNYCSSSFCNEGKEVDHFIEKKFVIIKINEEWYIEYFAVTR